MSPEEKSWPEYRLLFEKELEDNRAFRAETRKTLLTISQQMAEIKVERRVGKWLLGVALPAVVAFLVSAAAKRFGM